MKKYCAWNRLLYGTLLSENHIVSKQCYSSRSKAFWCLHCWVCLYILLQPLLWLRNPHLWRPRRGKGGGIIDLLFIFENGRGESQAWPEVRLSTVALKKKTPFSFYQRVQTTKVVHWKRVYSSALDLTVKKNGLSEGSYTLGVFKLTPFSFRISGKTTPMSL